MPIQCQINHCAGCTDVRGPPTNCHFLPSCFDIWTLRKRSKTTRFVWHTRNVWFKR